MKAIQGFSRHKGALGLSVLMLGALCHPAAAQYSMFSQSIVGVTNGFYISSLDFAHVTDNSVATASTTHAFTGLDRQNNPQTMTFAGNTVSQSNYGRLRVRTTGSLTNSYYNESNPAYADNDGNVIDPDGSPTSLVSLGFAVFNDTLHYGGSLESGYRARYIFHVDGTNSGTGALADLAVDVDNNPGDSFFAFDLGYQSAIWATRTFEVNGITPQRIHVQFSTQVVFDTLNLTDGQNYAGQSDFSSTLTLAGIEMLDQNGNLASGWTVTSDSGTQYNAIQGGVVPEPGSAALLISISLTGIGLMARRRKR